MNSIIPGYNEFVNCTPVKGLTRDATLFGLLEEITGQARNRLYCADEISRAIDTPME